MTSGTLPKRAPRGRVKINEKIVKEMNRTEWIAYSADTPCEENREVAVEFLNTLNMSGFPMHELRLKKVCL